MTNIERMTARAGSRPLTIADFEAMQEGEVAILHYHAHNQGSFVWIHHEVQEAGDDGMRRVSGLYLYPGERFSRSADPEAVLYEFQGVVVRGSGAEPLFREMPAVPVDCDGLDPDDEGEGA